MRDGYSITRHGPAIAFAGRFFLKLHRTTPLLPCALVTLPQIARYLLPFVTFFALYTYTTLPQTEERVSVWVHRGRQRRRSPATQRCWLLCRHTAALRHWPAAFQGGQRAGTS